MESDSALKTLLGDQTAYHDFLRKNKELEEMLEYEGKHHDLSLQNTVALEPKMSKIITSVARCTVEKALTEVTRKLDALSPSPSAIGKSVIPSSAKIQSAVVLRVPHSPMRDIATP